MSLHIHFFWKVIQFMRLITQQNENKLSVTFCNVKVLIAVTSFCIHRNSLQHVERQTVRHEWQLDSRKSFHPSIFIPLPVFGVLRQLLRHKKNILKNTSLGQVSKWFRADYWCRHDTSTWLNWQADRLTMPSPFRLPGHHTK